ncbi:MAG: hypothetical protein AAGJ93_07985 [Bacteroidota bacterium]
MHLQLLLLNLLFIPRLYATTYCLDYAGGNNANDGLSPATAWKNLFKIREVNSPGDVFLFKRGEVWRTERLYITVSGTSSQPISYGAYSSTGADPVITTVDTLAHADEPNSWTTHSTNVWKMPLTQPPGRLFLDGQEYLRGNIISDVGTIEVQGPRNYWYYEAGELYLYATQNPALAYAKIEGSTFAYTVLVDQADHLIFSDLNLQGGFVASIGILGGQEIMVTDCSIPQN